MEISGVAPHVVSELSFPPFPVPDSHWHTAPASAAYRPSTRAII